MSKFKVLWLNWCQNILEPNWCKFQNIRTKKIIYSIIFSDHTKVKKKKKSILNIFKLNKLSFNKIYIKLLRKLFHKIKNNKTQIMKY